MNTFRMLLLLGAVIILFQGVPVNAQQKVNWNGYLQYRFTDNYLDQTNFSIRRAKLWLDGNLPTKIGDWSYKVQANFYNKQSFLFLLQDVYLSYALDKCKITAGQFVPDFGLQRRQSDYLIPLTERASVINSLLPSAETMGRDVGLELGYKSNSAGFSLGLFNGNGANSVSGRKNFLYSNRGYVSFGNSLNNLQAGYSIAYRKDNELKFSNILGSPSIFSGKDFRFGFDARLKLSAFEFQSEYIEAHLGSKRALGYYALADYLIAGKNLITVSLEQLNDYIPSTIDRPWYTLGYSYLIKGYFIKVSIDNKLQFINDKTNSLTVVQVQYFFNQE